MSISKYVVVVTRTLPGNNTVVHTVIGLSEEFEDDLLENDGSVESYLREKAEMAVNDFKDRFVEFRNARWEYNFVKIVL